MQVLWKKFSSNFMVSGSYLTRILVELFSKFAIIMGAFLYKIAYLHLLSKVIVQSSSIWGKGS